MTYSAVPKIGEGSTTLYEDPLTPGSFLELDEITGNGAVGTIGEFVDATPLRATSPRQITGAQQAKTSELIFFDVPANTNLAGFLALALSHSSVKMRQVRSSGRQIDFLVTLSGREFMEQVRGEPDKVKVPYTQIEAIDESEAP